MSAPGDLDIGSGGIVAVDTESLRAAAAALRALGAECDDIEAQLGAARRGLGAHAVELAGASAAAQDAAAQVARIAGDLDRMADVYEFVEVSAQIELAGAAGDQDLANALRGRILALVAADPGLLAALAVETARWRTAEPGALWRQNDLPFLPLAPGGDVTLLGLAGVLLSGAATTLGLGTVPRGTRLGGPEAPVTVTRLGTSGGVVAPPASLADTVDRIPRGEGRVRVERYTMPDGSRRFAAYVAGTVTTTDRREPMDWWSNLALYGRGHAASEAAVAAALADAGARPGDSVELFGHSQGGMAASSLALSEEYDVPLLVTYGDPVQAEVGESTLSVAVRHLDDPVSALAGGGTAAGVGAAGSFVATRETPGTLATGQSPIDPHLLGAYRETATMLDASTDPRMGGVRERLAELAQAGSVEVFTYSATRDIDLAPARYATGESSPAAPGPSYGAAGVSGSAADRSTADGG
ncbi:MAG: hypothetical protein J0I43_08695 [Microbacterium sp.]|uniref:hypothetical protein n=1 Tax=Microbacterium sp. TaxID=51671 RepID=UPI001AD2583E|nr:hypothetical protein [Microbacterium sp.]MBN9177426.1 hypothetical protein [Microbacterium sp.]